MQKIQLEDQNGDPLVLQEGESFNLVVTFADLSSTPVSLEKTDFDSCVMTLYSGDEIINSKDGVNVIDGNGGTMAADGTLTLRFDAADGVIMDDNLPVKGVETHVARLAWGWNDGTSDRTGIVEYIWQVEKLSTPT